MMAARGSFQVTQPSLPPPHPQQQSMVNQYTGCMYMRHPKRGPKSPLQTMRDVTIATFCSSRHQDPGQGVLWKFWKCTKVKQENKGGAPSVLKCNNPADLEALNSLILKKVSSRVYWSKYHFNLNNSQVISLKSVPNVYTEQMKLNQRSLSSDVTAVDNYSEVDLQNLFAFLAALAALGLPWSLRDAFPFQNG